MGQEVLYKYRVCAQMEIDLFSSYKLKIAQY